MAEGWLDPSEPSSRARSVPFWPDPKLSRACAENPPSFRSAGADLLVSRTVAEIAARWGTRHRAGVRAQSREQRPAPSREVISAFVDALFDSTSARCRRLAGEIACEGDPQRTVTRVFEPAARMIGERWCSDENNFLQVTIAASRMQQMFLEMAADHPPAKATNPSKRALLAPAPGEQHGFGLSVVEDAFRRAGWAVDRCGCDEERRLVRMAASGAYAVVGLSIGGEALLPSLRSLLAELKVSRPAGRPALMAGGGLMAAKPQLAAEIGFDYAASDARSGVAFGEAVLSAGAPRTARRTAAR